MANLRPIQEAEFTAFLEYIIPDYAAENVRAGYWDESEALEKSRKSIEGYLPQGVNTPNHHLFIVEDEGQRVGLIWMRAQLDTPIKQGFIFDINIDPEQRGKGYGKQAMLLIEEKARQLGLQQIGLHVFADNQIARGLYEKVGYRISSCNMLKDL